MFEYFWWLLYLNEKKKKSEQKHAWIAIHKAWFRWRSLLYQRNLLLRGRLSRRESIDGCDSDFLKVDSENLCQRKLPRRWIWTFLNCLFVVPSIFNANKPTGSPRTGVLQIGQCDVSNPVTPDTVILANFFLSVSTGKSQPKKLLRLLIYSKLV